MAGQMRINVKYELIYTKIKCLCVQGSKVHFLIVAKNYKSLSPKTVAHEFMSNRIQIPSRCSTV